MKPVSSTPGSSVGYVIGAVVCVLGLANAANAWTPISGSRPTWCRPVPYAMHQAGSSDLGPDMTETLVRQGMDDWSRVACTSLMTSFQGRTPTQAAVRGSDGRSVIGWIENGWIHDPNAIGVTRPLWARCIEEADMEMNGVHYQWVTGPGRGGQVNAYSIILHEGGHYYGLGHSNDRSATMYFAYTGGVDSLNADDQAGICSLYPGTGSTPQNCDVTGCPAGQECVGGQCQPIMGDGTVCAVCQNRSECGGPNDLCLDYGQGVGYCGSQCFGPDDCPSGSACADLGGFGQCVGIDGNGQLTCDAFNGTDRCRDDAGCDPSQRCDLVTGMCEARPTTGSGLGEPCEGEDDCNSGLCLPTAAGSVCSQTCNWLEPTSCPSGFYCNGTATGSCGSGVCLAGSAGQTPLGGTCERDIDCDTLLCSGGTCATPCVPDGAAGCPDGYMCQVGATSACGACRSAGAVGAHCELNDDCAARICACRAEDTERADCWCTTLCDESVPCPQGFLCEAAGDVAVCARDPNAPMVEPRANGETCSGNEECASNRCECSNGSCVCTQLCDPTAPCPEGSTCETDAEGRSTCTAMTSAPDGGMAASSGKSGRSGGCGCRVRDDRASLVTILITMALAVTIRRRRSRAARR